MLTYSGDTAWADALIDPARGADLFICQAYFYDQAVPHHLDYAPLRRNRDRLGCRRILLTHMSADMLERQGEADDEIAHDGLIITL